MDLKERFAPHPLPFTPFPIRYVGNDYNRECLYFSEEQDMNAHVPYCKNKDKYPLTSCYGCSEYKI